MASSFLESSTEKQREAAQAKAALLTDQAIVDYLSEPPKEVEEKPSILEEIAGAFRSNTDPLHKFYEHPFIMRYREEHQRAAVMPPRLVQKQMIDSLLKDAPANMKL